MLIDSRSGRAPPRGGELAEADFAAHVDQALRDPIAAVLGQLETLADSPAERKQAIARIRDELERMDRSVDDLLLLAEASRPDFLRSGPLDVDPFTHGLFTRSRGLGARDWRLDGVGLGSVTADQARLTQAMTILVDHALGLTDEGEAIWLGSSLIGEWLRLWVRIDGSAGTHAGRDTGAGLRLAIVQAIAKAHGGLVELDSRRGVGSTVTIVLPAEPAP